MEPAGRVISPAVAAARLGLSVRSVYRLIKDGLLPVQHVEKTISLMVVSEEAVRKIEAQLPEGVVKPRQVRKILIGRSKK